MAASIVLSGIGAETGELLRTCFGCISGTIMWADYNLQRILTGKLTRMRSQAKCKLDLIKRDAMGNQQTQRQLAPEDQRGGFLLNIDRSAVGTEQGSFADADAGAGKLDSFLIGRLREK